MSSIRLHPAGLTVVTSYSCNLADGSIIIPRHAIRARVYIGSGSGHVWLEDARTARGSNRFRLKLWTPALDRPILCNDPAIRAAFRHFVDSLPVDQVQRPVWPITHRDMRAAGAPRDRVIPAYMQHGRPSRGDSNRTITQTSVTAGCVVGKMRYTEEGYAHERLGLAPVLR